MRRAIDTVVMRRADAGQGLKTNRWAELIVALALCLGVGLLGAIATRQSLSDWYPALRKPEWNPPSWLFGPVWSILYVSMAVSAWIVWRIRGPGGRLALSFFGLQLALNAVWSPLFFGFRSPALALVDIVFLWLAIVATIIAFRRSSRPAAFMMLPYLAWVSFAASLNFEIWKLNS